MRLLHKILNDNNVIFEEWTRCDMEIPPPTDTCPLWITKKLLNPSPGVFVVEVHVPPFHWFKRYAYLKLGVLASCQLYQWYTDNWITPVQEEW